MQYEAQALQYEAQALQYEAQARECSTLALITRVYGASHAGKIAGYLRGSSDFSELKEQKKFNTFAFDQKPLKR